MHPCDLYSYGLVPCFFVVLILGISILWKFFFFDLTFLKCCLNQFIRFLVAVLEGPRDITPTVLKSATGLEGALFEKQ